MKKKVKIILLAALGVVVVAGIALSLLSPLAVELVQTVPQTALLTFTEEGIFDYSYSHSVFPLVSGEVLEVSAVLGQQVSAGDVIAVLSASDFENQIEQMQSAIRGHNAQIHNLSQQEQAEFAALRGQRASLEGQLAALEAQVGSQSTLEAQLRLQGEIIVQDRNNVNWARELVRYMRFHGWEDTPEYYQAQQQLNQARRALAASQAQLEALRGSDAGTEGQRQSIQAQIDAIDQRLGTSYIGGMASYFRSMIEMTELGIEQLEQQMGRAEVAAPVSGRITMLPVADSNLVSPGAVVAVIGSQAMVEVFIPIREVAGVSVGDQVELIINHRLGAQTISGTVAAMDEMAQTRLSALGVEERRVRALIRPEQSDDLLIGHSMDVRFTVLNLPESLIVPKTAVFTMPDGYDYVWVRGQGGRAEMRRVTRGVETRDGYVIAYGLEFGEQVVRNANQEGLGEGARIAG